VRFLHDHIAAQSATETSSPALRAENHKHGLGFDHRAPIGSEYRARDPHGAGPGCFRPGLDDVGTIGQEDWTAVTQVESTGYDPLPEGGRAGPGADVIKNGGGKATVKPTFVAAMFRQWFENGPSYHGSVLAGCQLNPGVEGTKKPKRFVAQSDDPRRPPANNVAK